jgi:biopolymer transport protein ExbD
MGMSTSSGGADDDVMVEMNTTPLIDVMLVLLIMLIITIPIQLHSVNLNLPRPKAPPPEPPPAVRVGFDAAGVVYWNGEALADAAAVDARLRGIAAQAEPPELHLKPVAETPYRAVVGVMANAQRLGLAKIGIVNNGEFR